MNVFRWIIVFASIAAGQHGFSAEFVGSGACTSCHSKEYEAWQDSHHDHAMRVASPDSVLGDFSNTRFRRGDNTTRFFRKDNRYLVETPNSNGDLQVFEVSYTFGHYPLQQYLLGLEDGRFQALNIAWDTREAESGGQRWFHLYPDEEIPADDPLHWTQPPHNWNSRCADCHSTNLRKNYDADSDRYNTTWSEIHVGCEACHGPASDHLEWAKQQTAGSRGFDLQLPGATVADIVAAMGDAGETVSPESSASQIAVCGACHSRRSTLDTADPGANFHDSYRLSLLQEPLYHADGQVHDEVFVLGSYLQSRMYQSGVTCTHCHDPHSLQLTLEGNAVCTQCHNAAVYDKPSHHQHLPASTGSECVNCHMPETTFMVIDPRRDHSIRIPRPDLAPVTGAPNACNNCHADQDADWAAEKIAGWHAPAYPRHYGEVFASTGPGHRNFVPEMQALLGQDLPDIVQASALARLPSADEPAVLALARAELDHESPLVRAEATGLHGSIPLVQRFYELIPVLQDEVRLVRLRAFETLVSPGLNVLFNQLSDQERRLLSRVQAEYLDLLDVQQDSGAGQMNLANYHVAMGDFVSAENALREAMALEPYLPGPRINLADLYRQMDREPDAMDLLRQGVMRYPDLADLHYALGLSLVRQKQYEVALAEFRRASKLSPGNVDYGYVYAVALNTNEQFSEAMREAVRVLEYQPDNNAVLELAVHAGVRSGNYAEALVQAHHLLELRPQDTQLRLLVSRLSALPKFGPD